MSGKPSFEHYASTYGAKRAQSTHPTLGQRVGLTPELQLDVEALRTGKSRRFHLDVTVEAIVALAHRNFARDATSWRKLLAWIHGTGRDHGTLVWIESDVSTAPFVASEAADDLRSCAVGGAERFGNGMHRQVAAACWLTTGVKGGKNRTPLEIRKVNVTAEGVLARSASLIRDAVGRGATVHACARSNRGDHDGAHIRIASGRSARFFEYKRGSLTLEEIALRQRLREWVHSRLCPAAEEARRLRWQRVTPRVAGALTSDKWLQQQLESPRYPHLPT